MEKKLDREVRYVLAGVTTWKVTEVEGKPGRVKEHHAYLIFEAEGNEAHYAEAPRSLLRFWSDDDLRGFLALGHPFHRTGRKPWQGDPQSKR